MKKYLPSISILLACLLWGMNSIFVNTLDLPTSQQTFFRLLAPTLITGCILLFQKKHKQLFNGLSKKTIFLIAGANALRMYLLTLGFLLTTTGNAVIAQRSNAIIIIILAAIILHEKITKIKIISLFLGLLGLFIVAFEKGININSSDHFIGIASIVLSAAISSYLNIQYKQKINEIGATRLIFLQSFFGMIIFGIFAFWMYSMPDSNTVFLALLHSLLIGVVGFYLYFWSLKYLEVGKVTILTFSEIIFGIIFGYMFLGQIPSFETYFGMICVITSGIIITWGMKKSPPNE